MSPKSTGQLDREQHTGPHLEGNERETGAFRGCAQRPQPDGTTRPGDFRERHGRPPGGQARNQAESGAAPKVGKTGVSPARDSPTNLGAESALGPPGLLLDPPGRAQDHHRGRQMPDNGLGGQSPSVRGHGAAVPGPAWPAPDSLAQWLSQGGRQSSPFRPRAARLAPPPLCVSGSCKGIARNEWPWEQ